MLSHPAHFIALGFGSGLARVAPGTFGTLWAWLAYVALDLWVGPTVLALVVIAALPVGWWACTVAARNLRVDDPSAIVWDEVAAFWLILWLIAPATWVEQLAVFVLFRVLDAAKPGPVGWADRHFKGGGWRGGFGILFDDLVAAGCTLLAFAVWRSL